MSIRFLNKIDFYILINYKYKMTFEEIKSKAVEKLTELVGDSELSLTILEVIQGDVNKYLDKNNLMHTEEDEDFTRIFLEKFRVLYENLNTESYVTNTTLLDLVKSGKFNTDNLIYYYKLHNKWKIYKDDLELMNKEKSAINPDMATTTQFTCSKCKRNTKCCYFSVQTRSSDEPMTNFITCMECNHNWRE